MLQGQAQPTLPWRAVHIPGRALPDVSSLCRLPAGPGRGRDVGNPAACCQLALPALGDTSWAGAKALPRPRDVPCWPPPGLSRMLRSSRHHPQPHGVNGASTSPLLSPPTLHKGKKQQYFWGVAAPARISVWSVGAEERSQGAGADGGTWMRVCVRRNAQEGFPCKDPKECTRPQPTASSCSLTPPHSQQDQAENRKG